MFSIIVQIFAMIFAISSMLLSIKEALKKKNLYLIVFSIGMFIVVALILLEHLISILR